MRGSILQFLYNPKSGPQKEAAKCILNATDYGYSVSPSMDFVA